jgi:hypothetical protein
MNMWKKKKKENLSQEKIEEQFKNLEVPILDMPPRGSMRKVRDTYSVGYIDGDTVLKLTCGDLTLALTLSPSEVRRLIRLLEATMDEPENVKDSQHNATGKANDSPG